MFTPGSLVWQYLSDTQRQLASDGTHLIDDRKTHPSEILSDYSYLVFPFAKLYEGFLKRLFRDLGVISQRDYESAHFRVGKVLSPNLVRRLGFRSAYKSVSSRYGQPLADHLWTTWREGRNLVFHYFPHNVRRLSFDEAVRVIQMINDAMDEAVAVTHPGNTPEKVLVATGSSAGVSYI